LNIFWTFFITRFFLWIFFVLFLGLFSEWISAFSALQITNWPMFGIKESLEFFEKF